VDIIETTTQSSWRLKPPPGMFSGTPPARSGSRDVMDHWSWLFDSPYAIIYRCSIVTEVVSRDRDVMDTEGYLKSIATDSEIFLSVHLYNYFRK